MDQTPGHVEVYIAQGFEQYDRLREELGPHAIGNEDTAVVAASFIVAVRERFGPDPATTGTTTLIAETRSISPTIARDIDPRTAERLILAVTHGEDVGDLEARAVVSHEIALIAAMVKDLEMDEKAIDEFFGKVQGVIDGSLG